MEFLNEFPNCINHYKQALKYVEKHLDKSNPLFEQFQNSIKDAKNRYNAILMKSSSRTFSNLNKT